jgi:hypothetical protein
VREVHAEEGGQLIHWSERPSLAQLRQALVGTEKMAAVSADPMAKEAVEKLRAHIAEREKEEDDEDC